MTAIDQKEIRGLNIKTLLAIIISTITIVWSFAFGVGKINTNIKDVSVSLEKSILQNEIRVRTIEVRLDALDLQLQDLKHSKSEK